MTEVDSTPQKFWAKTTSDGQPGVSVYEHMLNVGHVAFAIASGMPGLLRLLNLKASTVAALAALHDVGKISPGFQQKCEAWLKTRGIFQIAENSFWDTTMESNHGKTSHVAIQKYLVGQGAGLEAGKYLSAILGGHHGRLNRPDARGFKGLKLIDEKRSGIEWEKEREAAADTILSAFGATFNDLNFGEESPVYWWLGGLTSVADWIGSDERYFPVDGGLSFAEGRKAAEECLCAIGWGMPQVVPGLTFPGLFGFAPNDLQTKALSTIVEPGVYIIEAPMGMGKTEAALGAAYTLLEQGKANGIYFALPTQTTSNRMHHRMAEFVRRISSGATLPKIVHGNSWLLENAPVLEPVSTLRWETDDARAGRDWFSSAKRALLAPYGVGTVDQALLGIVAAKHFFVRQFALAGKIVILDEIHSYDLYTGTLIDGLVESLEQLGCTVIILSATLSGKRREKLVTRCDKSVESPSQEPYPLITGRKNGTGFSPVAAAAPVPQKVGISFKTRDAARAAATRTARAGGCVLWVCDTVDAAQQDFRSFSSGGDDPGFPVGLLHSRFPFWRREELEKEWLGRFGKDSATRLGCILVSTQIVEQSVDLDADLLITELAPTDMLLQRMGRLWRHHRNDRPVGKPRVILLKESQSILEFREMPATAIKEAFGPKAHVYDPYRLLRTLMVWEKRRAMTLPGEIRRLIEHTYEEPDGDEPEAWQGLEAEWFARDCIKKRFAERNSNLWQLQLDDEEGAQTRLEENPTRSLILCRTISASQIELLDGMACPFSEEEFLLATALGIHQNLVKIPAWCFEGEATPNPSLKRYVRGLHAIGLVQDGGTLQAKGLKAGIGIRWDIREGIIIDRS